MSRVKESNANELPPPGLLLQKLPFSISALPRFSTSNCQLTSDALCVFAFFFNACHGGANAGFQNAADATDKHFTPDQNRTIQKEFTTL